MDGARGILHCLQGLEWEILSRSFTICSLRASFLCARRQIQLHIIPVGKDI